MLKLALIDLFVLALRRKNGRSKPAAPPGGHFCALNFEVISTKISTELLTSTKEADFNENKTQEQNRILNQWSCQHAMPMVPGSSETPLVY